MSFAAEIKDFLSGFQTTRKALQQSAAEIAKEEYDKDQAGLTAAQDEGEASAAGGIARNGRPPPYVLGEGGARRGVLPTFAGGNRAMSMPDGGEIETRFVKALKDGGLTNPYGLAAVAAYASHESRFSPKNIMGSWSDPSESGQAGTSGGILSWRDDRLANMLRMTAGAADPVVAQAKFMLTENPQLTMALQKASSPEEANQLMADAWRFAGYNRRGGEFDARLNSTRQYLKKLGGQQANAGGEVGVYAAEGGVIPPRVKLMFMREEDQLPAETQTDRGVLPVAQDDAMPEVQMDRLPAETAAYTPPTTVAEDPELSAPLPPRRPREVTTVVSKPAARRGVIPIKREPDNGAQLPGEGLQAGTDEPYDPKRVARMSEPNVAEEIGAAIQGGFDAIAEFFGLTPKQGALPIQRGREGGVRRLARNEGAATRAEIRQIDQTIDPNRTLNDDERAVARLHAGYTYYLKKGEPERAKKYAASILLYTRDYLQRAGALAEAAGRDGNVPAMARIITEAHNQIPDGQTIKVEQATPQGVSFAMYDEDGNLTQRGQASVNQLMAVATGMRNGSEWFTQMSQAGQRGLTAAQRLRQRQQEADANAAGEFYSGAQDSEFMNSLNPQQRDAFMAASPQLKAKLYQQYKQEVDTRRRQEGADLRQRTADERRERLERKDEEARTKAERADLDQQEYAGHLDRIRDAAEALQEQRDRDPYDTAKIAPLEKALADARKGASDWTTADKGRGRYATRLNIDQRQILGGGRATGAGGSGGAGNGTGARGGTKDERNAALLDGRVRELQLKAQRSGDPADAARASALKADVEWQKRDSGEDREAALEADTAIAKVFKLPSIEEVPDEQMADVSDMQTAVRDILRGDNGLSAAQAVNMVRLAVKSNKITRNDDGSYSINGGQSIFLSDRAFKAIARAAARANPKPQAASATTQNPFEGPRGNDNPAYARMRDQLGNGYQTGMTMAQMRRALRDRGAAAIPDELRRDPNLP